MQLTDEDNYEIQTLFTDLIKHCPLCQSKEHQKQIYFALRTAYEAHYGVRRKTGEAYITHPVAVAKIVGGEIGLGVTSVMCALLHDVIEDNVNYTPEDIERLFNSKVKSIVVGLTKIKNIFDDNMSLQAETFKKMLLTIPEDIRVIYIKIADRLHNMRTLHGMPANKQQIIASETIYVYAPIAHRLGLYAVKNELEDLSFKYRMSDDFQNLAQAVTTKAQLRKEYSDSFIKKLNEKLEIAKIKCHISVKTKSLYSTWQKMTSQKINFDDIHNFISYHIVFENTPDTTERFRCFEIFYMVTEEFKHNNVRDWVKEPRPSGFQAYIFDIMGDYGEWMEIQVMSERMHNKAERGDLIDNEDINSDINSIDLKRIEWIRNIYDHLQDPRADALELLDIIRLDLFTSVIYVFTPKGKVISLPKNATVLDFAFQIHSNIGMHCIGAKVNRETVGRKHILASSDQVEILTSEKQIPERDWLDFVITGRAKSILKIHFKKTDKITEEAKKLKDKIIEEGKEIVRKLIDLINADADRNKILDRLRLKSILELYYKAGTGELTEDNIKDAIPKKSFIEQIKNRIPKPDKKNKNNKPQEIKPLKTKELVIDEQNEKINFIICNCCNPVFGDDSIAFIPQSDKIYIHRKNCKHGMRIQSVFGPMTVPVKWEYTNGRIYLAQVVVSGLDRSGMANDITNLITKDCSINMSGISLDCNDSSFYGTIKLRVKNVDDIQNVIAKVKNIDGVTKVQRTEEFEEKPPHEY